MTAKRIALEATIAAAIAFVLSLIVFAPLLSRLDAGWSGGDMLSTYVNVVDWGGYRYEPTTQFGFPLGMTLNYFPGIDITQNTVASLLNTLTGGTFTGINLLVVLSFPLIAALAYLLVRMTGLQGPLAIALAVAFTFIPFHWGRALGHTYLAVLYSMVAGMGLVLAVGSGSFHRFATAPSRRRRVWFWVVVAVMVVVIAWSGVYWAAFTLLLGAAALLWRVARKAPWRAIATETIPFAAITVLSVIGFLPSVLTIRADPPMASLGERLPYESVIFAGNLAMALLPFPQSQIPGLGAYNDKIVTAIQAAPFGESTVITNHGTWITSLALLVFVIGLILRARRPHAPVAAGDTRVTPGFVGYLIVVTLLFFVPWGLNYLLAGTVTAQIRAWNRLLPVLLLLFLLGAATILARSTLARKWAVSLPIALVILGLTAIDSVLPFRSSYAASVDEAAELSDAGRDYAARANAAIPEDCGVLQLPYMGYPEFGVIGNMNDYDHFWQSITNPGKEWSYGSVKYTDASTFAAQLPELPTAEQMALLKGAGFCAIHVDTRAYVTEELEPFLAEMTARLGEPVATALDDEWLLFSLDAIPSAPAEEGQAFLMRPWITEEPESVAERYTDLGSYWWWTAAPQGRFVVTPIAADAPFDTVTGAVRAAPCGPLPVTVRLEADTGTVETQVLASPDEPRTFELTLPAPTSTATTLVVEAPGEGCPAGGPGRPQFVQVLDATARLR